jgi:hypothetical protein
MMPASFPNFETPIFSPRAEVPKEFFRTAPNAGPK